MNRPFHFYAAIYIGWFQGNVREELILKNFYRSKESDIELAYIFGFLFVLYRILFVLGYMTGKIGNFEENNDNRIVLANYKL